MHRASFCGSMISRSVSIQDEMSDLGEESARATVEYVFGFSCKNSINILSQLSYPDFLETVSFLDRRMEGFSIHEPAYYLGNLRAEMVGGLRVVDSVAGVAGVADVADVADVGVDAAVDCFPQRWVVFFEQNYQISSNPDGFRCLLELINEIKVILDDACCFLEHNSTVTWSVIDEDGVSRSFCSLSARISAFDFKFSSLNINIRISISSLVKALLSQLEHSLKLGCVMELRRHSNLIPEKFPRFTARAGSLVDDTKELRSTILSVMNVCNFVPLEEIISIFEKKDKELYKDDIIIASSLLEPKYNALISFNLSRLESLVGGFIENVDQSLEEEIREFRDEIRRMEDFISDLHRKKGIIN
ncbi:putative coiled coil protein [Candidatus Ichthyocystis hellenicum]|uniref:Putative coiled coil protein n=1 Tax=Candidatus Ichthyocystis hellenicum TaxID=1561003 RepID=A0A0S4M5A8_9BURK|nr:hypothetical protein [Candidatus Ichthyocystis hellenicum]CUT18156.1 putative coiled coil protein [Candidatus Ichthyocystis hellenicum]